MQEIPLVQKKYLQGEVQFEICKEGLGLLRTLKTKKLRIIFNITHQKGSLAEFNNMLMGIDDQAKQHILKENVCLTVTKHPKQLEEERIILILNAYQVSNENPMMVLLGYLAASVFIYHHTSFDLSEQSQLTNMLCKLKKLLAATDINRLQIVYYQAIRYSKNPHFLCLLNQKYNQIQDAFRQFYHYQEHGKESLNEAVDTLIDFLPQRSSLALSKTKASIRQIGQDYEKNVVGREIFNFELTGSTIENLCFECCQAFNIAKPLNLNLVYSKIIENQKVRLEDEALERYLGSISKVFFGGNKIDYNGSNAFPTSAYYLLQRHHQIVQEILDETLNLASYCMTLNQYKKVQISLRKRFSQTLNELQQANNQKVEQFCRQCYELLENFDEFQLNSSNILDIFRQVTNKFELFITECGEAFGKDLSLKVFTTYLSRLQTGILSKFSQGVVQSLQTMEICCQELRVDKQDLKYNVRLQQNMFRQLQHKYNLQLDILNQYKQKLIPQSELNFQISFSQDINKFRKRIQELQQQVKDKTLHIEELQGIIQRFQGLNQRERGKYKFSKEIIDLIKEVSNEANICHAFIKDAKKTNQLYEQIKEGFAKEKQSIIQERKKVEQDASSREAEFQKIIKEKTVLEEVVNQARQSIQVYKQVEDSYKESISNLQNTYTQAQCLLADTQGELQLYKKGLSLTAEQQNKGSKLESLNKFYRVSTNQQLKNLLKPFIKK